MSAAASPPREGIESYSAFQLAMAQTEVEDVQPAKLAWHVEDHSLDGARWSGSSGASLAVAENGARCLLSLGVRVVPVTNEMAAQPLIEGPLIAVASITTLLRESNGRLLGGVAVTSLLAVRTK
ncbi:MAG: hypothetical protein QOF74_8403 [Caballeronia mineralivorans]|nr:hypothetical protein [Caballeronia mineralivorans]